MSNWKEELKELLKCDDVNCQEGHYPLGVDEDDMVVWGGCPNCVPNGENYLPRVNPLKLQELINHLRLSDRDELIKMLPEEININFYPEGVEVNRKGVSVNDVFGYNQCLKEIKQLIKDFYHK